MPPRIGRKMAPEFKGRRRVGSGDYIHFDLNIDPVIDFLGVGTALERTIRTKKYTSAIFDAAFDEADIEFNVQAAAFASAGGKINHMYEWGTIGINRSKSNRRPSPMSAAARLWKTAAPGSGFKRTITYYFLPSFANVPKPTTSETGMSQEVIQKMRDHVFRWKAEMMEWGRLVTLVPDKAKFLLIPVTEANEPYVRKNDIKRGYTLAKGPIQFNAGGNLYSNQFTAFFMRYWEGSGQEVIQRSVVRQVRLDFEPKITKTALRQAGLYPPPGSITARVEKAAKKYAAEMQADAEKRRIRMQEIKDADDSMRDMYGDYDE